MKNCKRLLVFLIPAVFGVFAEAEPQPDGTLTLPGSFPDRAVTLPDGAVAFTIYAEDGNRRAVHVLDGATLRRRTTLPLNRELSVLDDSLIVAGGLRFDIYDAKSGTPLNHKQFSHFYPPRAGASTHWLEGDVLSLIQKENDFGSSLRRIRLPQLEVIERFDAPVTGVYARWKDKIVAVGMRSDEKLHQHASITVFDTSFRVVAESSIDKSPTGSDGLCQYFDDTPLVMGDLLVFNHNCGDVRVFDLANMRQVAARDSVGPYTFLRFGSVDGRLIAAGTDENGAYVDEIELPSLAATRLLRVSSKQIAFSGANFYAFREAGARGRETAVDVYSMVGRKAERSLSDSIIDAKRTALRRLQGSSDLDAAIAVIRTAIPRPAANDLPTLTPDAMRALAWYAGLLVQAGTFTDDAAALLDALRIANPDDFQIRALAYSAVAWPAARALPTDSAALPVTRSAFTTGTSGGVIARMPLYLLAARWCPTLEASPRSIAPGSPPDPVGAEAALAACWSGKAGIAVHDWRELRFQRYIPVIVPSPQYDERIDAIMTFGDIAVISIERGFPDDAMGSIVSVDIGTGTVLARSNWILRKKPRPTKAIACNGSSCAEVDPRSLRPGISPLADGVTLDTAPPQTRIEPSGSPYVFAWRRNSGTFPRIDDLLEARDRASNALICVWPGLLTDQTSDLFHNPQDDTLVIVNSTRSPEDLKPSIIVSVPTLVERARDCDRHTQELKASFDLAMRALQ